MTTMIRTDTPIGKIISETTEGTGEGYYYPDKFTLSVYYPDATHEQRVALLRKLQTHISNRALWASFENISVYS